MDKKLSKDKLTARIVAIMSLLMIPVSIFFLKNNYAAIGSLVILIVAAYIGWY